MVQSIKSQVNDAPLSSCLGYAGQLGNPDLRPIQLTMQLDSP